MALLASSDEATMAELSPSMVGEDIAAVEAAAAANPNPPTTQLDPNITKLVQTWHASQKAELQGKYETQQLRREMKAAKKEIIKEMKRKKVTAIQLGENSYLLLFVTGHESVVKPELLASELASVTVAECEAAHKALVLEARKRHHDIAAKSTSAEVLKRVLKKRMRPLVYTKVENLRWAAKPRRKDVVGAMAATVYTDLRTALTSAVQQRHTTLSDARRQRHAMEQLATTLLALPHHPKQLLVSLPIDLPLVAATPLRSATTEPKAAAAEGLAASLPLPTKGKKRKERAPRASVNSKRARLLSAAAHRSSREEEGAVVMAPTTATAMPILASPQATAQLKISQTQKAVTRLAPLKVSAAARLVEHQYLQHAPAVTTTTPFNPTSMASFLSQQRAAVTTAVQHDLQQRKAASATTAAYQLVMKLS